MVKYVLFSLPAHGIECPTCFNKFPVDEILQHADLCASTVIDFGSSNINPSHGCLLDDIGSEYWNDDAEEPSYQALIHKAMENMDPGQPIRINVTRKTLWDDFTKERARRVKPDHKLKVVFVGEPAIDDGGPRREFFSGNFSLCPIQYLYLSRKLTSSW